jgi:hypothetical protein
VNVSSAKDASTLDLLVVLRKILKRYRERYEYTFAVCIFYTEAASPPTAGMKRLAVRLHFPV